MNLAEIDHDLQKSLASNEQCIGFVIRRAEAVWLIDWSDYFTLDQQKNIDAMCTEERYRRFLPTGLTVQQWNKKLKNEFRDGITQLTDDLLPNYRYGNSAKVITNELLMREFFLEDAGQYTELYREISEEMSFNKPMKEYYVQLRMRLASKLPKFYINYDRKIFMHMVRGRSYEAVALDGWWAAEGDFEHMIPTSHRYWVRNTEDDFWAVTNFSNG